jgi:hypothetical protein
MKRTTKTITLALCFTAALHAQQVSAFHSGPELQTPTQSDIHDGLWLNAYCVNPRVPFIIARKPVEAAVTISFDITADGKTQNIKLIDAWELPAERTHNVSTANGHADTDDDKGGQSNKGPALAPDIAEVFLNSIQKTMRRWEYFAYLIDGEERPRSNVEQTFTFRYQNPDLQENQSCATSFLPDAPSHTGNPQDGLYNVKLCSAPYMPRKAERKQISEAVSFTYSITKGGKIINLERTTEADKMFVRAAERAIKTWTYHPFQQNGQPIKRNDVSTTIYFGALPEDAVINKCSFSAFGSEQGYKPLQYELRPQLCKNRATRLQGRSIDCNDLAGKGKNADQ